jgi:predicted secreted protein
MLKYLITFFLISTIFISITPLDSSNSTYTLDDINSGNMQVTAIRNKPLTLRLKGNITTGFGWFIVNGLNRSLLRPLNLNANNTTTDYVREDSGGLLGSGGYFVFKFMPLARGNLTLAMINKRPWEDSNTAIKLAVNVAIK